MAPAGTTAMLASEASAVRRVWLFDIMGILLLKTLWKSRTPYHQRRRRQFHERHPS
jgi:hypothetical protein